MLGARGRQALAGCPDTRLEERREAEHLAQPAAEGGDSLAAFDLEHAQPGQLESWLRLGQQPRSA